MRHVVLLLAGLSAAVPLAVEAQTAEQMQERVHVVRRGDTLWDIARSYLQDPFLWPELFRLNTDVVQNPARIYPDGRIRIPGLYAAGAYEAEPGRTIFFPRDAVAPRDGHSIRPAGTANVPVLTPGDFHRAGFLARNGEVRAVGRIAERIFPSVVALELPPQIQLYDRIFVVLDRPATVGERLQFYRPGRAVRPHGRIFHPTGIATVAAVDDNVATAVIVQVFDAIGVGDFALPVAEFPVPAGVMPVPVAGAQGEILAFQDQNLLHPTQGIAFLNLGEAAGVSEGDEFVAFLPRQRARWGVRPEIEVARLQVVRVTRQTAAARVVGLSYPALEPGLAVRQVARMP